MVIAGIVTNWNGKTATVRLRDGRTVVVDANGRSYIGIGTRVFVALDEETQRAVLV